MQKGCPIQAFIKLSEYNQTCELWITAHEHDHTNASQNLYYHLLLNKK